jgi:hypothetical protein
MLLPPTSQLHKSKVDIDQYQGSEQHYVLQCEPVKSEIAELEVNKTQVTASLLVRTKPTLSTLHCPPLASIVPNVFNVS